jgi:CheY-like chemotaxis protein
MLTEWDEEPTHEYPSLTRSRVLLAEDDPELRELVADRLRREGCEVVTVGTGSEALDRIAKAEAATELDLAILDVRMPGMRSAIGCACRSCRSRFRCTASARSRARP